MFLLTQAPLKHIIVFAGGWERFPWEPHKLSKRVQLPPPQQMRIAILGFSREGRSLLKYLRGEFARKKTRNGANEIWILDRNKNTEVPRGFKSRLGKNYLQGLEKFHAVFRSPGVPYNLPQIQKALKKGIEFSSATKLFFESASRRSKVTIIGVTGTKGKGTTSALLYEILKACGKDAHLAGNIGKPALEILSKLKDNSVTVLELSSFQLQDLNSSPHVAIVTDVFPDHLDAHKNFKEYVDAKANIAKWQKKSDAVFYFANNKYSRWIARKSRGRKIAVDLRHPEFSIEKLRSVIKIPGEHNIKNALMAMTAAKHLGCSKKTIWKRVAAFRGLPHRLEFVRSIRIKQPYPHKSAVIKFYDDSASTNPHTAAAAASSFNEPLILIAGGQDKNLNYSPLTQAIKKSGNVKLVVLFGENKSKIKKQVTSGKQKVILCKNLNEAIRRAYHAAKSLLVSRHLSFVTILFSPGAASFDMFRDYADRGEKFKKVVKKLK